MKTLLVIAIFLPLMWCVASQVALYNDVKPANCMTPDQKAGLCKPLSQCLELKKIFYNKNKSYSELYHLLKSKCQSNHISNVVHVCCESYSFIEKTYLRKTESVKMCVTHIKKPHPNISIILPNDTVCGQMTTDDRIIGGKEARLGEYPWAILIEYYSYDDKVVTPCSGSLISEKYVLTAAHCVTRNISIQFGNPVNIRLGEHDKSHPGPDCEMIANVKDCDYGTQIIAIEKIIIHPCYENAKLHDIALIRMKEKVEFTDFIRPICLPQFDITLTLKKSDSTKFVVVGWGTTENALSSNIKQFAILPYFDFISCKKVYKNKLTDKQLCAGGLSNIDSCGGDSGGSLLYRHKHLDQFELTGIVSFGPTACGTKDTPGVYTKVWTYIDWIKGEIRP